MRNKLEDLRTVLKSTDELGLKLSAINSTEEMEIILTYIATCDEDVEKLKELPNLNQYILIESIRDCR